MNTDKKQTRHYSNTEIGLLADAFGKSLLTIQRWIDRGDDRLTSQKALEVLERNQPIQDEAEAEK